MALTARQLNRATLERQSLLRRASVSVTEGIRGAVALQAQEPASPYIALWNRIDGFDPTDLDTAFREREIIKATLMRVTLHAVHRYDYATIHGAMVDRLRDRLNDSRFTEAGLSRDELDALIPLVVEHTYEPRTASEIQEMLGMHLGDPPHQGVWWAMKQFGPVNHAPTDAPWSFGPRNAFIAAPQSDPQDPMLALAQFIRRYLDGFGPASARDFGQFTLQTQAAIKPALASMDDIVVHEGPNGEVLYDVPNGVIPDEDTPAPPRLMAMWDSVLLAYSDRTRVIPEEFRKTMIRRNGDVLPTLLVDGFVAGVWRPTDDGIEATAFRPLSEADWDGLTTEAANLQSLLDRDPTVYRRYQRWWNTIEGVETRILA